MTNPSDESAFLDGEQDPFDVIAEEFSEQIRQGNHPSIDAFAVRYPQFESQIRELFPLILEFEKPLNDSASVGSDGFERGGSNEKHTDFLRDPRNETRTYTDLEDSDSAISWPNVGRMKVERLRVGRYKIQRPLGEGGFGRVYLAFDEQLQRSVAIKMPSTSTRQRIDAEEFIREARIVAQLEHPVIVPVYDVGQTDDGQIYIVSRYIRGTSLAERIAENRLPIEEAIRIIEIISDGLHYAHNKGLVHRDIKPANILLDEKGMPYLTDFGIALSDQDLVESIRHAGTPKYMSPEQARGEGHLIDGRSDIFSLGIVLHELLTGVPPFRGKTPADVMQKIINVPARPLRQYDSAIPVELERICLRALSKHPSDRYPTAFDFGEDLRAFLASHGHSVSRARRMMVTSQTTAPVAEKVIVPKGFAAFDRNDADFFPQLLPGPVDRDGIPDSIRFWRHVIESTDQATAVRVGVIYGPSGCGKSSLIRAGVLPNLRADVDTVLVNASQQIIGPLCDLLERRWPELSSVEGDTPGDRLVAMFRRMRRDVAARSGRKIVIVLDQFEQCLHRQEEAVQLANALRQCDGVALQAILAVRVDYWLRLTRFMQNLEPRHLDASNSRMVDLFDRGHARDVLIHFGRAYGALPAGELSLSQQRFVDEAIDQLQVDDKVIAVRIVLFVETVKDKAWEPSTLKQLGGVEGIAVRFLDETLGERSNRPEVRFHRTAIRNLLKSLLPQDSSELKGEVRTSEQLKQAAGYVGRDDEFSVVLTYLENELRLITAVDRDEDSSRQPFENDHYQLAHDYLVPPIREWLNLQERSTRAGRARLALAEHVQLWKRKPVSSLLPSLLNYLKIRAYVPRHSWTADEARMMDAAGRRLFRRVGIRFGLVTMAAAAVVFGFLAWNRRHARDLAVGYLSSRAEQIPALLTRIQPHLRTVRPIFENVDPKDLPRRMRADLALLPIDSRAVPRLADYLLTTNNSIEYEILDNALSSHRDAVLQKCWDALRKTDQPTVALNASRFIARHDPSDDLPQRFEPFAEKIVEPLVYLAIGSQFDAAMRRLGPTLVNGLHQFAKDPARDHKLQETAIALVGEFADDRQIVRLLVDTPRRHLQSMMDFVERRGVVLLPLVREIIENADDDRRRAIARLAAFRLGRFEWILPAFHVDDDPTERSYVVSLIPLCRVDPSRLFDHLANERNRVVLHGLIIALAECRDAITASDRNRWSQAIAKIHRTHQDAGVHGACEYLLRHWNIQAMSAVSSSAMSPAPQSNAADGSGVGSSVADGSVANGTWFVNSQGQTFVVIRADSFSMGSDPKVDPYHLPLEALHPVELNRTFAVSTTPVTVEQFDRFASVINSPLTEGFARDAPIARVTWFNAAKYCNWLNEQEGIPRDEWCYETVEPQDRITEVQLPRDYLQRKGYRLLTEAEWEYACRAGKKPVVNRYFGNADELLPEYAWYDENSRGAEAPWPVGLLKPNQFGLFDMLGNVHEWTNTHRSRKPLYAVRSGVDMIMRGGSFRSQLRYVRNACPYFEAAEIISPIYGFRIARTIAIDDSTDDAIDASR